MERDWGCAHLFRYRSRVFRRRGMGIQVSRMTCADLDSHVLFWDMQSSYWVSDAEASPGPGTSDTMSVQVEASFARASIKFTIALVVIAFILSLGSALAALYTAWAVIIHGSKIPGTERLVGSLTVVATILGIRTVFPLAPVPGTSLGACHPKRTTCEYLH